MAFPEIESAFTFSWSKKDRAKIKALKQILQKLRISTGEVHNPSRRVDPDYWRIFVSARSHKRFAEIIGSVTSNQGRNISKSDDDIVQALWRHREAPEQGTGRGTCSWINSIEKTFFSSSDGTEFIESIVFYGR